MEKNRDVRALSMNVVYTSTRSKDHMLEIERGKKVIDNEGERREKKGRS